MIADKLNFDHAEEVDYITSRIRQILSKNLLKRGLVVAISGGIDSSVCAALAVQAVGKDRVFGLLLPECDSSPTTTERGLKLVKHLDIKYEEFDITNILDAAESYFHINQILYKYFENYSIYNWKYKIVINPSEDGKFNYFKLVVQDSKYGKQYEKVLSVKDYLQIVAATNFKQRSRKMMEYFHADKLNYAVVGTPNRLEYDQGFFVKGGDGLSDIKPIAHLYKTQVYALARFLNLPEDICNAVPTTDTYTLTQGQDEFYFSLPYEKMDIALLAFNEGLSALELSKELNITEEAAQSIYNNINSKRKTTASLHWNGITLREVRGPFTTPLI